MGQIIMIGFGVGLSLGLTFGFMGQTLKYIKHLLNHYGG